MGCVVFYDKLCTEHYTVSLVGTRIKDIACICNHLAITVVVSMSMKVLNKYNHLFKFFTQVKVHLRKVNVWDEITIGLIGWKEIQLSLFLFLFPSIMFFLLYVLLKITDERTVAIMGKKQHKHHDQDYKDPALGGLKCLSHFFNFILLVSVGFGIY